ncbi:hypothetical protein GYMLUDRAFT_228745 [Collybiopsis luxurians FD-317 M1]|uniref:Uncharacterized protein n=1 Tax=Collybiopsis luxurians FD-317 M1 TaxID=944289 RepID=A0A0D0B375_9AGAR|nr:hypothetical protein GYMLUDRAFT_228745 [Collybiopsis luxurians FD-317 M1]
MSGLNQQNYARTVEQTNQGIIDGRPEGQQPPRAPVTFDTVVDKDASLSNPQQSSASHTSASATLNGATSLEVDDSLGKPGSGMTSKELRHDGMPGRKKGEMGDLQWQRD